MRQMIQNHKTTWIEITKPSKEDVDYLKEKFNFHPVVLNELIPRCYHPRLEVRQDYLFLIINYPLYREINKEVAPRELDIIITKDTIITNHLRPLPILENIFKISQRSEIGGEQYLDKGPGYVLFLIMDVFWRSALANLDKLGEEIDQIERKIFRGRGKEMVKEISYIKTDIIDFWRIIEPQLEIMKLLEKEGPKFFGEELTLYFSDALGTYERIWQALKTHKETIFALEKTNQSLLTTETNEIIKILTIFSFIIMPLNLLASIWGMNVRLPFGQHQLGFLIVVGIMIFAIGAMFVYFKKKKWL